MRADKAPHIVIIGAGYAGRAAATRLGLRAPKARISVVEPRAMIFERARLHQVIAGTAPAARPLSWLLPRGAVHVMARAERVELARREVWVQGRGEPLVYDRLIVCLGARTPAMPGAWELDDPALPARVSAASSVSVLGAGLSGVEIACEVAERRPGAPVTLATRGELLPGRSAATQAHARGVLARLGVTVREGVEVVRAAGGAVECADGQGWASEVVIAATGFAPLALSGLEGCMRSADGRVVVTAQLTLPGRPEVMVLGDAAAVADGQGGLFAQTCAAALPMGSWAGDAIAAWEAGAEPQPFGLRMEVVCLGLGARDGVIERLGDGGYGGLRSLRGRSAAWVKDAILAMTVRAMWAEQRAGIALYTWPGKAARMDRALSAQGG
jgi:NADH:ubiquinone reductase (H+-translocating)